MESQLAAALVHGKPAEATSRHFCEYIFFYSGMSVVLLYSKHRAMEQDAWGGFVGRSVGTHNIPAKFIFSCDLSLTWNMDFLQRQVWAVPGIWRPGGLQSFSPGSAILFPHVILSSQHEAQAGVLIENWVLKTNVIAPSQHHQSSARDCDRSGRKDEHVSARKQIQTGFDQDC